MKRTNDTVIFLIMVLMKAFGFLFLCMAFIDELTTFGAVLSLLGSLLLVISSFCRKKVNAIRLDESLLEAESFDLYRTLSETSLAKRLLAKELKRQQRYGEKLRSKAVLTRKTIYCAAALLILAFFLFTTYHRVPSVPKICIAILVFVWLWNKATPEQVLYEKAMRNKTVPFSQLVKEDLYDGESTSRVTHRVILMAGALILLLAVFFTVTDQTRMWFTPTSGGMMLTGYQPARSELTEVTVPETVDGQPVVAIGKSVFEGFPRLERIILPDTVREIGSRAFKNCSALQSITLPADLTSLGGEAFMDCYSLTGIRIPEGVTELRGNTFENCTRLADVQLHDGIIAIHAYCFRNCDRLEEIQLPPKITEIRTYTFESCGRLKRVDIPSGVTRIASHAFEYCSSLSYVNLPDSLTEIGSSAFRNCSSLMSIELPINVQWESNAFKDSPTQVKVKYKEYSNEQWERICQEMEKKTWQLPLYYVYDLDQGVGSVCRYGNDQHVVLTDSPELESLLSEKQGLQALENNAAVIDFLEKANESGNVSVQLYLYTQIGTEIQGRPEFIYYTFDADYLLWTVFRNN